MEGRCRYRREGGRAKQKKTAAAAGAEEGKEEQRGSCDKGDHVVLLQ